MSTPLIFGGKGVSGPEPRIHRSECINFIKHYDPQLNTWSIRTRSGYSFRNKLGLGPIRGMIRGDNLVFIVSGDALWQVDSAHVYTSLGTLDSVAGRVSMSWDGDNVVIVDGSFLYTYKVSTTTFAKNTDIDIPATPTHVVFNQGFHYIVEGGTAKFHTHDLPFQPDGAWNGTNFATAEYVGDDLTTIARHKANVFLLGPESVELWETTGETDFPVRPNRSGYLEVGCAAEWSVSTYNDSLYWLSQDKEGGYFAVRVAQTQPQRISTPDIEHEWSKYKDIKDTYAQVWVLRGHMFWILQFPTANKTWVYDATITEPNLAWSEFQYFDPNPDLIARHPADHSAFFEFSDVGPVILFGTSDGSLYYTDFDLVTDDGNVIQCKATSQEIKHPAEKEIHHASVEIYLESGHQTANNPGEDGYDPKMRLGYSDDHGHTWKEKQWKSTGTIGQYNKRVIWKRLGQSRHRLYRITTSEGVPWTIIGGILNAPMEEPIAA